MELVNNFWQLFVEAAPWLLFGFLIAGVLHAFLPDSFMQRHLGGKGIGTTVKAAFIGAPLPLCSCGVIPAALGLRRSGASKNATVAFLVATPETGVDSVSVSYAMLGPIMAIIRPIAAICSAIVAGVLVGKESLQHTTSFASPANTDACSKSTCCESGSAPASLACSKSEIQTQSFSQKLLVALSFSTGKLVADTAIWLIIGLFFAALIKTFVATDFLAAYGQGILAMTLMVIISIPMYICATASTPIAAGLLFAGLSPGSILVFMLAGPATNVATLGIVFKEMGKRALTAYLFGVIATAMVFGILLDFILDYLELDIRNQVEQHQHLVPESVGSAAALILIVLLVRALFVISRSKFNMSPA